MAAEGACRRLHAAATAGALGGYLAVQMRKRRAWVPSATASGVPAGVRGFGSGGGAQQAERERRARRRVVDAAACVVCHTASGGRLWCCAGVTGCDRGFHTRCLAPRLRRAPERGGLLALPNPCYNYYRHWPRREGTRHMYHACIPHSTASSAAEEAIK